MNRSLSVEDSQILMEDHETLVEVDTSFLPIFTLEFALLLRGLIEGLTIYSNAGRQLTIRINEDKSLKKSSVNKLAPHRYLFILSKNQAEYISMFLLRAYRDGMAEVNHIHIDGITTTGNEYDLTLLFDLSKPSMSASAMRKLLAD